MPLKSGIYSIANWLENRFDSFKYSLKKKRKNYDPVYVVPFLGFGSEKIFHIKGRVLENKGVTLANLEDSSWRNFKNMFKRFESDEVAEVELKINFNQKDYNTTSDEEGYFELNQEPGKFHEEKIWHELEIEILKCHIPFNPGTKSKGKIIIPSSSATFGVISDIDDTIVATYATSIFKMTALTFFKNAKTRSPFKGVSAFYKSLERGNGTEAINPFFYVSSSPWNLYDFLMEFLETHNIPVGPLMLKDYGIDKKSGLSKGHMTHKYEQIQKILNTYPSLPFVLIGDCGQQDPEIYRQVVKDFPGRIISIYIRDVQIAKHRQRAMQVCEEMKNGKVPMILVKDSLMAAEHAAASGFISKENLPAIEKEVKKDSTTIFA